MRKISYNELFNKIYGCFLGKCIGGTAGGPAEGRKELLDAPLDEAILHSALPNDDLDLQIIWLELLEEKGAAITAKDMAREFYEKIPYGPGEYGYAKKNYAVGIYPPTSGSFNNEYYKNGMGCPIRSEIWACLFPGESRLAHPYVEMDGSIDHERDSIDAEHFLVHLESEAFFAKGYEDVLPLIESSLCEIPGGTKIHGVLSLVIDLYKKGCDWKRVREAILKKYGHPDCTNLYQNMGLTLLALLWGGGDFRETVRLSLAVGYDTDCIAATAASVLGILRGAEALLCEDKMTDTGLCIGVRTRRRTGSIKELAEDVAAAAMSLADITEGATEIYDRPDFKRLPKSVIPEFYVDAEYVGEPVLYPDRISEIKLRVKRNHGEGVLPVSFTAPSGVVVLCDASTIDVKAGEEMLLGVRVSVEKSAPVLRKSNVIEIKIGTHTDTFGLMGAMVWKVYGPFLMNNVDLTDVVPAHVPYGSYIKAEAGISHYDTMRDYHLSTFADIEREFADESLPFYDVKPDGSLACEPEIFYTGADLFDISDFCGYTGPHTQYLVSVLVSPEEREIELAVGNTAPFKLWLNGEFVGKSDKNAWWTCENRHFYVNLKKGENTLVLKCAKQTESAKYSVIPKRKDEVWVQYSDIDSKLL